MSPGSETVSTVKDQSDVWQFWYVLYACQLFLSVGIQLHPSNTVDIKTVDNVASITVKPAHKEHEGVYTARLRTWDDYQDHSAYVYVKGEEQHESGFDVNTVA